jgi:hypothetical protein
MHRGLFAIGVCLLLAADGAEDAVKKELAAMDGEWYMVSAEREGRTLPGSYGRTAKVSVDPSKTPKTIDYAVAEGQFQGQTQLGIYELDGDDVKYCFADPGNPRPTDFTTRGKIGYTVGVWKRIKK